MRKEINIYFKNRKFRNIAIASISFIVLFILINGIFIYIYNPYNYYFNLVKKIFPYPALTVGNKIITMGEYDDLVSINKRIYENAYRIDFGNNSEGKKNLAVLLENTKNEIVNNAIMEDILMNIGQEVKSSEAKNEYGGLLNNMGGSKEIEGILKYSSNIKDSDVIEKIYEKLVSERTRENVIYNLKMKVLVIKPKEIGSESEWRLALDEANAVSQELKKDQSGFDKYSLLYADKNDYIVQNLGRDYYFSEDLPDSFRPSFQLFEPGMISDPIKGDSGYYIFKIEKKRGYYNGSLDSFLNDQKGKLKIRYFLR